MKILMFSTHSMKYIWYSPQKSKYPLSIYAMWHIQLTGYESANLSLPVTNINLKIGLQTASPVGTRRKRFIANTGLNHRFVTHSALMPIRCYTFSQQEMQVKYMYMYFVYIKYEIRHYLCRDVLLPLRR